MNGGNMNDKIELRVRYSSRGSIYGQEEVEAAKEVMLNGETLVAGPRIEKFQEEFAKYIGSKYAFATSSATTALHLTAKLIGIKPGDEVITTPLTYISTSEPILERKAAVIFADIDPKTLNIEPEDIERKITPRTKAIYVVHFAGQPCNMDPIMELAKRHKLYVIEDAAHTPGAEYKGKKIGSIGDMACFSFHGAKNMSTGEGGMLTTNNDEWAEQIPVLRQMGLKWYKNQTDAWLPYYYDIVDINGEIGNNYRMSEIEAAIGSVQLKKLDNFNEIRRKNALYLNEGLKGVDFITVPYESPDVKHAWHLYQLLFDGSSIGVTKDDFLRILIYEEGVEAIIHYLPGHLFSIYKNLGYKQGLCPAAERIYTQLVTLPFHPALTKDDLDVMIEAVKSVVKKLKERKKG